MELIRTAFDAWKADSSRRSLIALLEASQHSVYGTCFEVLRHRHDAEDAAQRVLVEIQAGLDRIADTDHFLKRLRLVAFHTALDARRARRRRVDRERKASDMNLPAPVPDEVREAVHDAMAALDEDSRGLVIEHYFEKATLEEMGDRRGLTGAAIWKRIEAVKGRLRDGLALAGLGAAAAKAEACLESVAVTAAPVNLVTGSVLAKTAAIGGGLMAAKTSTGVIATLVATFTFAIGLGGGLSIQAARDPAPPMKPPVGRHDSSLPDEQPITVPGGTAHRAPEPPANPAASSDDSAEDRLKLAQEIWAQFSRPRFWKDRDARDETLPKLKLLGPDQARFFIERYRDPEVKHEQKMEAVRLAVTCGGPEAAALILELINASPSDGDWKLRLAAQAALKSGFTERPPDLPVTGALWEGAITLRHSDQGWDRVLAICLLSYGAPREWIPIVTEMARSDPDGLMRSEAVELLVRRGGVEALEFLRGHKEAIRTMAPDSRYGAGASHEVEFQKDRLGRVVDEAIEKLGSKLKK